MPITPTVHTFDPQVAGMIGAYIDVPPSYDQVIWFASMSATTGFVQVDTVQKVTTPAMDGLKAILDTGVPVGGTVYLQAKLHDSTGYGAVSAGVAATVSAGPPPPPPPTAPGVPTSVGAAAGDGQASVYWTLGSNGGSALTGYTITPYKAGVAQTPVTVDASKASAQLTGLTDGQSYTFTVIATNAIGSSAESAPSSSVTPAAPLTDVQMVQQALGVTLATGDKVNVYPPTPTTVQTVNADQSIS